MLGGGALKAGIINFRFEHQTHFLDMVLQLTLRPRGKRTYIILDISRQHTNLNARVAGMKIFVPFKVN